MSFVRSINLIFFTIAAIPRSFWHSFPFRSNAWQMDPLIWAVRIVTIDHYIPAVTDVRLQTITIQSVSTSRTVFIFKSVLWPLNSSGKIFVFQKVYSSSTVVIMNSSFRKICSICITGTLSFSKYAIKSHTFDLYASSAVVLEYNIDFRASKDQKHLSLCPSWLPMENNSPSKWCFYFQHSAFRAAAFEEAISRSCQQWFILSYSHSCAWHWNVSV